MKSELKRLNEQMKSLDDSIRNLEAATSRTSTVDLAEITQALHRLDPIWEVLYPEEQSRILELLIETVRVSENNVDIRFRTNGFKACRNWKANRTKRGRDRDRIGTD